MTGSRRSRFTNWPAPSRAIPRATIFYSDEDRLSADGQRHSPFFKPEWSPEYLLSSMYLGHLTVYRRDLVARVGEFRREFDLSQDYDFALRATEQAREICHVPHVLYHWREHPASGSAGGKPEARKTNLAALAAAMERRGLAAEIMEYPTANRVRLKISHVAESFDRHPDRLSAARPVLRRGTAEDDLLPGLRDGDCDEQRIGRTTGNHRAEKARVSLRSLRSGV